MQFEQGGWIEFLSQGRHAYEKILDHLPKDAPIALAQAHYDVGVSCWYEARALYSANGKHFNAFGSNAEILDVAANRLQDARKHLRLALDYDPSYGLAWNALGVVLEHPLTKQFAWIRAIQTANSDVAWANLGMLYVHNRGQGESRSAELARNAFLHLQAINTNNPAMWIGYGMIYLGQHNKRERRKAREAFQCALEMGNHLDALQGFVLSSIMSERDGETTDSDDEADDPSFEQLQFAIKKYLERESFDANAWSVLSLVQFRLGLVDQAAKSSAKSLELLSASESEAITRNVAVLDAIQRIMKNPTSAADFQTLLKQLDASATSCAIVDAQRLYYASDKLGALKSAHSLLGNTANATESQLGLVAGFALALSALTAPTHSGQAKDLGNAALAALFDRVSSGQATADELAALDAFHRSTGSLESFVSTSQEFAQSGAGALATTWSLALVDLMDPKAFTTNVTTGVDVLQLKALKSLLASDQALAAGEASSPMKLVRAEPWNPAAYALAALRAYKATVSTETPPSESTPSSLASALRLLQTGLLVAETESTPPSSRVLLHWAYALIQIHVGDQDASVKAHAEKALAVLNDTAANGFSPLNKLLWEARVHALSDRSAAITKYVDTLAHAKLAATSDAVLGILYEIGAVCESFGLLDAAHHVWKTVMAWKSPPSSGETEGSLNVAAFVGNLRLAIVHASKNNAKSAKKFAKTAASLAGGESADAGSDAASSSVTTTTRFVESVIAKM